MTDVEIISGAAVQGDLDASSLMNPDPPSAAPENAMPAPREYSFRPPDAELPSQVPQMASGAAPQATSMSVPDIAQPTKQVKFKDPISASSPMPTGPIEPAGESASADDGGDDEGDEDEDEEVELSQKELDEIESLMRKLRLYVRHFGKITGDVYSAFEHCHNIKKLRAAVKKCEISVSCENSEGFCDMAFYRSIQVMEEAGALVDVHIRGLSNVLQTHEVIHPQMDKILKELMIQYSDSLYVPAIYRGIALIGSAAMSIHHQYDELLSKGLIKPEEVNNPIAASIGMQKAALLSEQERKAAIADATAGSASSAKEPHKARSKEKEKRKPRRSSSEVLADYKSE